jgi:hypothetical protein
VDAGNAMEQAKKNECLESSLFDRLLLSLMIRQSPRIDAGLDAL